MSTANKLVPTVTAKTANYTFTNTDWGGIFTNRGATGGITFTLPAVSATPVGAYVEVFVAANQDVTVASTADEMITFNDIDANAVAWTTSSEKLGAAAKFLCDGTSWLCFLMTEETQTTSVTT